MNIITYSKAELERHIQQSTISHYYQHTPAGLLKLFATELGIFKVIFVDEKEAAASPTSLQTQTPTTLLLAGTPFQLKVWQTALQIPAGKTVSYQMLAQLIGAPKAYRAVANAMRLNPIAYFVPCHRVLRATGDICGYNWGVERKIKLLETEKERFYV
jgi:O-6-methylguanine DNA methyltransferase